MGGAVAEGGTTSCPAGAGGANATAPAWHARQWQQAWSDSGCGARLPSSPVGAWQMPSRPGGEENRQGQGKRELQ